MTLPSTNTLAEKRCGSLKGKWRLKDEEDKKGVCGRRGRGKEVEMEWKE